MATCKINNTVEWLQLNLERLLEGYCMEVNATNVHPAWVYQSLCQRSCVAACLPPGWTDCDFAMPGFGPPHQGALWPWKRSALPAPVLAPSYLSRAPQHWPEVDPHMAARVTEPWLCEDHSTGWQTDLHTMILLGTCSPARYDKVQLVTSSGVTNTGEDLAQGVGFWYAFLTSFWGPTTMVLSKREGLVAIPCLDKGWILAWSFGCLFL